MSINIISVSLIVSGFMALVISLFLIRNKRNAARLFAMMMAAAGIWGISYGLMFTTASVEMIHALLTIEYVGIAALGPLWLLFTMTFAGLERFLTRRRIMLLFVIPLITVILVGTNSSHHLHYKTFAVVTDRSLSMVQFQAGIWYWVHISYFYMLLTIGVYLMIRKYRRSGAIFRRQNNIIMVGVFLPAIFNIIYLSGFRPYGLFIDITPFAFIVSSIIVSFGLIRYQLFDIVPIARERIIEAMADGIMVTDASWRIVDVNPAMTELVSDKTKYLLGRTLQEVFLNLQLPEDPDNIHIHQKLELTLKQGGRVRNLEVTITPLFDENDLSGRILVCKDVTDQKQYEEKLESLNKLKDKLFSIISHDLRSPLISLLDLLSMTNEGMITDEELRQFLPQLQKNVGYTSSLLENLLQWSKSQLQNEVVRPVSLDLNKLSSFMIDVFRDRAARKGITIQNGISEPSPVLADQDMIEAVYRNLLSNAIKFCNEGDSIRVSREQSLDYTTVCISDTGIGIKESDLNRLFKADTFTKRGTRNEQGTGLGLLLAKDFIEKNHGRIWVESQPGEGSNFYFSLPNDMDKVL